MVEAPRLARETEGGKGGRSSCPQSTLEPTCSSNLTRPSQTSQGLQLTHLHTYAYTYTYTYT